MDLILSEPGTLGGMKHMLGALKMLGSTMLVIFLTLSVSTANAASVDDFSYESWDATYELMLNDNGRAVAHVTETVVPVFPDFDQNRGIVRGLPLRYEGAPAAPEDISVSDANGNAVPFEIEDDDTFRIILVGDNRYVHGKQTYVISYTLHDVIIQATETQVDEFYWDILPLERKQSIDSFTASIELSPDLAAGLTGDAACYFGYSGSTELCDIAVPAAGDTVVTVAPMELRRGQGLTVAIGFAPETVVQPPERLPSFALDVAPSILAGIGALFAGGGALVINRMRRKRRTFRGSIVAQYDVPDHLPPLIAGPLGGGRGSAVAAQFVHLAVSGVMRIEETETTGLIGASKKTKTFRLIDPSLAHDPLDQAMVAELFPTLQPNSVFKLPTKSSSFATKMQGQAAKGVRAATDRGYFTREASKLARVLSLAGIAVLAFVGVLLAIGSSREPGPGLAISMVCIVAGVTAAIIGLLPHKVHTRLGAETREYLEGTREFIRVVEAERFKMLQSYSGAERFADGSVNVVHIYEKLLPYAMLFGLEKEWGKELQVKYEEQGIISPVWYPSILMHGSDLGGSVASFSSSLTSAASYSSSTSGGSSGGGFSGGGGGGGFSGGR